MSKATIHDAGLEIVSFMDRYDEDYDEAVARFERIEHQRELAADRKKAAEIKAMITRHKQEKFRRAAHPDLYQAGDETHAASQHTA